MEFIHENLKTKPDHVRRRGRKRMDGRCQIEGLFGSLWGFPASDSKMLPFSRGYLAGNYFGFR